MQRRAFSGASPRKLNFMKALPKTILTLLVPVLLGSLFTGTQAQAAMIDGAITFAGGVRLDKKLALATTVTSFSNVKVQSLDGDFTGFVAVLDPTTMAATWKFNPSTPTPGLWSVGGFTFDLGSSVVVRQDSSWLLITGVGTVTGNGFDATSGSWNFSTQGPKAGGVFSFSGASQVPDSGATAILLGLALAGAEIIRRKLAFA
jgi:hypothetical protein